MVALSYHRFPKQSASWYFVTIIISWLLLYLLVWYKKNKSPICDFGGNYHVFEFRDHVIVPQKWVIKASFGSYRTKISQCEEKCLPVEIGIFDMLSFHLGTRWLKMTNNTPFLFISYQDRISSLKCSYWTNRYLYCVKMEFEDTSV